MLIVAGLDTFIERNLVEGISARQCPPGKEPRRPIRSRFRLHWSQFTAPKNGSAILHQYSTARDSVSTMARKPVKSLVTPTRIELVFSP